MPAQLGAWPPLAVRSASPSTRLLGPGITGSSDAGASPNTGTPTGQAGTDPADASCRQTLAVLIVRGCVDGCCAAVALGAGPKGQSACAQEGGGSLQGKSRGLVVQPGLANSLKLTSKVGSIVGVQQPISRATCSVAAWKRVPAEHCALAALVALSSPFT